MADQRIIMIHGRSTKPAKKAHAALQKRALLTGMERANPAKAAKLKSGKVKLDIVYYGDINNRIMAEASAKARKDLTAKDPDLGNAPCVPSASIETALDDLEKIKNYNKAAYRKVVKANKDLRFLDEAAWALSTFSAITTMTIANVAAIKFATADMGAYLMRRKVGSAIRERLQAPLRRALMRGDDICLVSHSMGCMVAYDVLWKFSRMSEYRAIQDKGTKVRWITLGCPLGEAGVKANLYDANERSFPGGTDKHPRNIVSTWDNVAAVDDFISHDSTMKGDYRAMTKYGYAESIKDRRIYNCYAESGTSNPHKFYGYLMNAACTQLVTDWIK